MIELLRRVAATDPDRLAVVDVDGRWSYLQLASDAQRLAAGLRRAEIERFAIVSNDLPLIISLLAASSLVGSEACIYAPDISSEDLNLQAARFDHGVVVTDRDDLGVPPDQLIPPDALRVDDGHLTSSDMDTVGDMPERRPLLVLTTGTTGKPRGVRHDWDRQLSRTGDPRDGVDQRWLLAYGPQQFAGLQVLIHVMGTGATLVSPPVRRPQAVMDWIHGDRVDHISATPTFWRFLLAEVRADARPAPVLKQITLGGEAAPASLLAQLSETFPDAKITHIYAGSEFGSTGAVSDLRNGLPASVLDRDSEGAVSMRIVDGELWVRSTGAMVGYYGEEDLRGEAWWPTGDLVEVVDGRIEFRGRKSDVVNVGGVKVHPLPVEERVAAVPGVRAARVYGRPNALVGAVVAADVVPEGDIDEAALKAAIREACADLPRPWQPKSIRVVEEIATHHGKTLRGVEAAADTANRRSTP